MADIKYPTIAGIYQKWGIWWIDFPEPIGRHPGIIISDDITTNYTSTVHVFKIKTMKTDIDDLSYKDFVVPVQLERDHMSIIVCNEIRCVDKSSLVCRIGTMIDEGAIEFMTHCIEYLMLGNCEIPTYKPTANHPEGYVPFYAHKHSNETRRIDRVFPSGVTQRQNSSPVINGVLTYVNESFIRQMLADTTFCPKDYAEKLYCSLKFRVVDKSSLDILKFIVATVREFGFTGIKNDVSLSHKYMRCVTVLEDRKVQLLGGYNNLNEMIVAALG